MSNSTGSTNPDGASLFATDNEKVAASTSAQVSLTSSIAEVVSSPTDVAQSSAQSSAESSFSSAVASSISSEVLSSTQMGSTVTVEPSSTNVVTSVVSASSQPPSTQLITSVVTQSPAAGASTAEPVTVVVTSVYMPSTTTAAAGASSTTSSASSSSSSAVSLSNNGSNAGSSSHGLSDGSKTAIAVVVPVVVVALLVLAGLFFWRKRKQRKNANEERRKEVEEYGYNPNNDPTLPVVAADGTPDMAEDHNNGYRGWGNTAMSNRKASTTLSGGPTVGPMSDSGSNPGGYMPASPTAVAFSDGHSGDNLMDRRNTFGSSDDLGALGAAPVAGSHRNDNIRRGPSNASSSYSAGNRSDRSDTSVGPGNQGQSYSPTEMYGGGYGFGQPGPYGDGSYGGDSGMPVVRDVSARRNTRIEAGGSYQQGNSGIAQNF